MTALTVTFDGTRLNSSDVNTGWGNYGSGGGAPASEAANAYQISTGAAANTGAVGKKVNSITGRVGIDYNGTAYDGTAAANKLFYLKGYIADPFDLAIAFGVEFSLGSVDQSNYHEYVVAGTDAALPVYDTWPPQGGYLITCIDPSIDTWANVADSGGAFDQTAIDWFGWAAVFQNGNAKSENVALDALDYGTGLTLLLGTGADPQGKYTDFVANDQDIINNRWGAAVGIGDAVTFRGIATIGSSGSATEFNDESSIITFPDGYHSRGLFGVNMNIQNASTTISDGCLLIGAGTRNGVDANDTRPDYEVIGTSGTMDFFGVLRNFRDVTFTSVVDVVAADIECMLLAQGSANISLTEIKTTSLTSVATLQDPVFGTTTDLRDTDFVQGGAGHAIELATAGTYNMQGLTFTGYGADTTDSAALDITASSGTVTINISGGGDTPTYKTAGATVVINNPVAHTVSNLRTSDRVIWIRVSDGAELENLVESAGIAAYSYNYVSDVPVYVQVLSGDNTRKNTVTDVTLGSSAAGFPAVQAIDNFYFNP